jgi:hypothetical protein
MGFVISLAKPHRENKQVTRINGIRTPLGMTLAFFSPFVATEVFSDISISLSYLTIIP